MVLILIFIILGHNAASRLHLLPFRCLVALDTGKNFTFYVHPLASSFLFCCFVALFFIVVVHEYFVRECTSNDSFTSLPFMVDYILHHTLLVPVPVFCHCHCYLLSVLS